MKKHTQDSGGSWHGKLTLKVYSQNTVIFLNMIVFGQTSFFVSLPCKLDNPYHHTFHYNSIIWQKNCLQFIATRECVSLGVVHKLCWQDFWLFYPLLTISTLWMLTKSEHFWTTYPLPLVNIVCERPLTWWSWWGWGGKTIALLRRCFNRFCIIHDYNFSFSLLQRIKSNKF